MTAPLTVTTHSPEETRAFAERLGRVLDAGDVLCLTGELGAGKTTFTQGLAAGLGLPPEHPVTSPTYTLVAEHPGGRLPLYHFDAYRLTGSGELDDLAFDEYLDGSGVVVIEWADRVADALPPDRLEIALAATGPEERALTASPFGERARTLWESLT